MAVAWQYIRHRPFPFLVSICFYSLGPGGFPFAGRQLPRSARRRAGHAALGPRCARGWSGGAGQRHFGLAQFVRLQRAEAWYRPIV